MKRITDPRSGYYHKNGRGGTAYESFVPQPLQHIVINVEDKGHTDRSLRFLPSLTKLWNISRQKMRKVRR